MLMLLAQESHLQEQSHREITVMMVGRSRVGATEEGAEAMWVSNNEGLDQARGSGDDRREGL